MPSSQPDAGETGETVQEFRAHRLRTTPPLPAIFFPTTHPANSPPPLPPHSLTLLSHLPRGQAPPLPHLHLLSTDLPAYWPLTFNLNSIPSPSAQTGIRIQPRNLKMYSGGDKVIKMQLLMLYLFLLPFIFLFYTFPLCSAKFSLFIKMRRYFLCCFLTLFPCHSENRFALTRTSQTHSFVMFP